MRKARTLLAFLAAALLAAAAFAEPRHPVLLKPSGSGPISRYSSPRGYHRHLTIDGRIIEHSDRNYGSAIAHREVRLPWYKYAGPLPPSERAAAIVSR